MEMTPPHTAQPITTEQDRPLGRPVYGSSMVYAVVGAVIYVLLTGCLSAYGSLMMQSGMTLLSWDALLSKRMLSKRMLNEIGTAVWVIFTDPSTLIVIVIMAVVGLIHHYFSGKVRRHWLLVLTMVGIGWLLMACLTLALIGFVQDDPNIQRMTAVMYLGVAALTGILGAFITVICASVSVLFERRYRRKRRNRLVRDVF